MKKRTRAGRERSPDQPIWKWELEFGWYVAVGWHVAVDFETDADFKQNGCCPRHAFLLLTFLKRIVPKGPEQQCPTS
jgi:hypothetical protein